MRNITVFIHGTFPHNLFPNPFALLSEKVLYRYFHCPAGLHKATSLESELHIRSMVETLSVADPHRFPLADFYTFGWQGELVFKQREDAAQYLYKALLILLEHYHEPTHITLITHSHGGNVALHLGQEFNKDLNIDQLIMLACPVQEETAHYIVNPIFKHIYSLHSHGDMLQVGDPQGFKRLIDSFGDAWHTKSLTPLKSIKLMPFFSERHFKQQKNLIQVLLQWKGRNQYHFEFLYLDFMAALPGILQKIDDYALQNPNAYKEELILEITE